MKLADPAGLSPTGRRAVELTLPVSRSGYYRWRRARLMREHGLQGRRRHGRPPCTTDSRHGHAPAPNPLLNRAKPTGQDQVWVTDITDVPTEEGFLYLAEILDGWSRRGNWHDNALMESFRSTLKTAAGLESVVHLNRRAAQSIIFDYIECL
jgi:transposase InsO family protein